MPGGRWWGALFFLFMVFAAMSTVLGVCENILAMVRELTGWSLSLIHIYLYEYKWWYVFGIAILLCVDLANIYIPQFIGDIIDGLTNGTLTKSGIPMMLIKILIAGLIMMLSLIHI